MPAPAEPSPIPDTGKPAPRADVWIEEHRSRVFDEEEEKA
jgi:hypothetical protein